jgi:hypothetical protein
MNVFLLFAAVEVLKLVTANAATTLGATPFIFILPRRFGGTYSLHLQGGRVDKSPK